jgi:hypothetical protein
MNALKSPLLMFGSVFEGVVRVLMAHVVEG